MQSSLQHHPTESAPGPGQAVSRLRVRLGGVVQGVGFRPLVYRVASELGLCGWVRNDLHGLEFELEGEGRRLQACLERLTREAPVGSRIESCEAVWLDPLGYAGLEIRASDAIDQAAVWIRPDSATCPECLAEVWDPEDRRFGYPFTNCTHCGPRFSILERLPYDRPHTSMRHFPMCPACEAEYRDPGSRRFHAQPNACPACGPQLALWDPQGGVVAERGAALERSVEALRSGAVVAVKGLGGFHLMVRADDAEAVDRLRRRKHREEKPLALMVPTAETAAGLCECSPAELRVLESPEAPIVLLRTRPAGPEGGVGGVAPNVAPGQANLGLMLPYTPLHHLLLRALGQPMVATSGNRTDEPICADEREALVRLAGLADLFLVHNRPIVRPLDDSILRVAAGRELVLRRGRGFAPLPIRLAWEGPTAAPVTLGVGAHLKNAVALAVGQDVFLSQHVGDLDTVEAADAFRRVCADLPALYAAPPVRVAADLHPDYASTRYALETGLPCERVQHHHAHIAAVLAENDQLGPVLGVSWDGTGLGSEGTIWGGEFLRVEGADFERVAHLRAFRLPGGDQAAREPARVALGLIHEWRQGDWSGLGVLPVWRGFEPAELDLIRAAVAQGVNAPWTSSVGRLFDGVAALLGVRQRNRYEGQAAMELEALGEGAEAGGAGYPLPLLPAPHGAGPAVLDWAPLLEALMADLWHGVAPSVMARRFHEGLVDAVEAVALASGLPAVALGGGCFQNRLLLEGCVARLTARGFRVYWPQRVPPNDGGLALGQVAVARWRLFRKST